MNQRFTGFEESVDKRFDDLGSFMDGRFEAVDRRFDAVDQRFDELKASFKEMSGRVNFLVDNLAVRGFRTLKPRPHPGNR